MPAFSSTTDCTPWVIGGLWPAELSTITDENATLAEHLRDDLRRITGRTNDELKIIKRAGLDDAARHAAEVRVIDEARSHATRRVESAVRHLHTMKVSARPEPPRYPRRPAAGRFTRSDDKTQVIPAVRADPPPVVEERAEDKTEVIPAVPAVEPADERFADAELEPVIDSPDETDAGEDEEACGGRHRVPGDEDDAAETAVLPELSAEVLDEVADAEPETTRLSVPFEEAEQAADPLPGSSVEDDEDDAVGRHRVPGEDDDAAETAVMAAVQDLPELDEAEPLVAEPEPPAPEAEVPAEPEAAEPPVGEPEPSAPEPEPPAPEAEVPAEPEAAEPSALGPSPPRQHPSPPPRSRKLPSPRRTPNPTANGCNGSSPLWSVKNRS